MFFFEIILGFPLETFPLDFIDIFLLYYKISGIFACISGNFQLVSAYCFLLHTFVFLLHGSSPPPPP